MNPAAYEKQEPKQKFKIKIFLFYKQEKNNAFSNSVRASAQSKQGNGHSLVEYLINFIRDIKIKGPKLILP